MILWTTQLRPINVGEVESVEAPTFNRTIEKEQGGYWNWTQGLSVTCQLCWPLFKKIFPTALTPSNFRTAGSQKKIGLNFLPADRGIESGTAGWEARTLPLCYAVPPTLLTTWPVTVHDGLVLIWRHPRTKPYQLELPECQDPNPSLFQVLINRGKTGPSAVTSVTWMGNYHHLGYLVMLWAIHLCFFLFEILNGK